MAVNATQKELDELFRQKETYEQMLFKENRRIVLAEMARFERAKTMIQLTDKTNTK